MMQRILSIAALTATTLLFSACGAFAGGAGEMCKMRIQEKRTCQKLFFVEYDGCDGDAICEENAMAIQLGCMAIPTDACGRRGGKGGRGGK